MGVELPEYLPSGRVVVDGQGVPLFWLSDGPAEVGVHRRLLADHGRTGLWPVIAEGHPQDPLRPWQSGELSPQPVSDIDRYDAAAVMRGFWTDWVTPQEHEEEDHDFAELEPFGRTCPGLAEPGEAMASPEAAADWYVGELEPAADARLMLARVKRGADLPAMAGWDGPVNHSTDVAPLLAMLRSWEERFGARVVRIGFDTLDLSIAAPPTTEEHALHVAAEHWAFCPDNIDQGPGSLREYAAAIRGLNSWSFWWD
ncbi:uncharacterized protein DUF4253 [Kribbella amoyensis]|uniref:Uncharacterized protein DUF4253 n=2 Tax=Kribbella amoyensis TaxID=996641 RepID=A0A561BSU0_9ACTN|nr:uncharacterized protein DUF4253 [Kribbella amoyensis]